MLFVLKMKLLISVSLFIFCYIPQVKSAKILFASCSPVPSHQKPLGVIWENLALQGHEIHVLTAFLLHNVSIENVYIYNVSDIRGILTTTINKYYKSGIEKPSLLRPFLFNIRYLKFHSEIYAACLNHNETRRLLENNKHFDLVIAEYIFPTLTALAAYYKAPLIGIGSYSVPIVSMDAIGNLANTVDDSKKYLPTSFQERLITALYSVFVRIYYHLVVLPRENFNVQKYISNDLAYIGDVEKNASLLLLNRNPAFHKPMPLVPAVIELGKISYPHKHEILDPETQHFIESSPNGIIYFSLGTSLRSIILTGKIEIFQNVFASLPYNIIWKWDNNTMENKPENVLIKQWLPQTTILNHPNVKLFITQGGLQSMEETIDAEVPIIGIPLMGDQTGNVAACVENGVGKLLNLWEVTEEKLKDYIFEVINNPKYKKKLRKYSKLIRDYPQDGVEKAVWWIEFVIRHKGAKHLRSSIAIDLPWWQYLLLDIYAIIGATTIIMVLVIYCSLKIILKLLFYCKSYILNKGKMKTD